MSAVTCSTVGCTGDGRYAAPGRGHADGCHYPLGETGVTDEMIKVGAERLRQLAPTHPTVRIWGRWDATGDHGIAGNAWAADPEDVAREVLAAALNYVVNGPRA